jgi:hypothetical protein
MKLLLAATIVLMLSAIAIAVPDSQQLGPYAVSFDLNANYQPEIRQPIENEEVNAYGIGLFVDNSTFATIEIAEYVELQDATLNVHKNLMGLKMLLGGLNVTNVEDKTIDGKDGFLFTTVPSKAEIGAPSTVYRAMYWLDSQGCECGPVSVGKTSVVITSTYPLDVTESLLSSLKIVKGEAAASTQPAPSAQGGQILPPA